MVVSKYMYKTSKKLGKLLLSRKNTKIPHFSFKEKADSSLWQWFSRSRAKRTNALLVISISGNMLLRKTSVVKSSSQIISTQKMEQKNRIKSSGSQKTRGYNPQDHRKREPNHFRTHTKNAKSKSRILRSAKKKKDTNNNNKEAN